jgi:hypothetical protein
MSIIGVLMLKNRTVSTNIGRDGPQFRGTDSQG